MGNLGSISIAIYSQGWDYEFVSSPEQFDLISHLVIPGVGSYSAAMSKLTSMKLIDPIKNFAENLNPIMGICLGMQILSEFGTEGGDTKGLGLIDGQVLTLEKSKQFPLPHVGWNEISIKDECNILGGVKTNVDFYFVHSFFFETDEENIISLTDYGITFPSIVKKNNVVGVQFHPEKSQANGLKIIDNFCLWDGKC